MQTLDKKFPRPSKPKSRLVILFDEAQILFKKYFGFDAFLFQCIRLWLRQVRKGFQFIAVFSGTASTLSNFFPDSSFVAQFTSRDSKRIFVKGGKLLPLPFYQTTTIGCLTTIKSSKVSIWLLVLNMIWLFHMDAHSLPKWLRMICWKDGLAMFLVVCCCFLVVNNIIIPLPLRHA